MVDDHGGRSAIMFTPRERGRYQGVFGGVFGLVDGARPADRRLFRRASELALDFLHQPAARPRRARRHRLGVHRAGSERGGRASTSPARRCSRSMLTALILLTSLGGHAFAWQSPAALGLAALTVGGARRLHRRSNAAPPSRSCRSPVRQPDLRDLLRGRFYRRLGAVRLGHLHADVSAGGEGREPDRRPA